MNASILHRALAFAAWTTAFLTSLDLLEAWRDDPHLKTAGAAFTVWLVAIIAHLYKSWRTGPHLPTHTAPWAAILLAALLSWAMALNVLGHLSFVAACLLPIRNPRIRWLLLIAAMSWVPASGWVFQALLGANVDPFRIVIVSVTVVGSLVTLGSQRFRELETVPEVGRRALPPPQMAFTLGSAALLVMWLCLPSKPSTTSLDSLPESGPHFVSRPVPLGSEEAKRLRGAQAIKRLCRNGDQLFWLVAIDGSENRHAVHDPLYCLRGQGWQIAKQHEFPLADGVGKRYSLARDGESKAFIYWFSSGSAPFHAVTRYWAESSARRLTKGRSGSEPILYYIVPISQHSDVQWHRILESATQVVHSSQGISFPPVEAGSQDSVS